MNQRSSVSYLASVLSLSVMMSLSILTTEGFAQDTLGSTNYLMSNVSAGDSISKADGVISSSNGFTTTTVTGPSVNPSESSSTNFISNAGNGDGSAASVGLQSGGGGGGGGCFASSLPCCRGGCAAAAGLAAVGVLLFVRRRRA